MRTFWDRLRHTILFEVVLIIVCVPTLSVILSRPAEQVGVFGIMMSVTAMVWNYMYNLAFDKALRWMGRPLYPRSFALRAIHSSLFELGFMAVSIPAVMGWMHYTFWQALALDVSFLVIVPLYAMAFNWIYDLVFPVIVPNSATAFAPIVSRNSTRSGSLR